MEAETDSANYMDSLDYMVWLATIVSPSVLEVIRTHRRCGSIEAARFFYSSKVYAALEDEGTKIWHYSPETIYLMLLEEQKTGEVVYPEEAL